MMGLHSLSILLISLTWNVNSRWVMVIPDNQNTTGVRRNVINYTTNEIYHYQRVCRVPAQCRYHEEQCINRHRRRLLAEERLWDDVGFATVNRSKRNSSLPNKNTTTEPLNITYLFPLRQKHQITYSHLTNSTILIIFLDIAALITLMTLTIHYTYRWYRIRSYTDSDDDDEAYRMA